MFYRSFTVIVLHYNLPIRKTQLNKSSCCRLAPNVVTEIFYKFNAIKAKLHLSVSVAPCPFTHVCEWKQTIDLQRITPVFISISERVN